MKPRSSLGSRRPQPCPRIASATSVGQVTELLAATEPRLTAEDLATLGQAQPAAG